MNDVLIFQIGAVVAIAVIAVLLYHYLKTKRQELVQKALEFDDKVDKIQVLLSKAAAKLEWIGLNELAKAGHFGAAIALDDLVEQLQHAVKLCEDKATLVRALTPCCVNMVALTDEYPELLVAVAKVAVKEPILLAKIKELQTEHQAKLAKVERDADDQKAYEKWKATQPAVGRAAT